MVVPQTLNVLHTPCPDGTYKIYGCDRENTAYDNVCIPMTTCFGKKTEQYQYTSKNANIQDPGEGNRTYMVKKGIRGSNDYNSNDNGSYYENDKIIDLSKGNDNAYKGYDVYRSAKGNIGIIPIYKTEQRQKDLDDKNLPPPYYGKDRECAKCDTCKPGYVHLMGCMGENDLSNTICQRQIDIEKYINRNLEDKVPPGKIYDKKRVIEGIKFLNEQLIEKDNIIRIQLFNRLGAEIPTQLSKSAAAKSIHDNIPLQYFETDTKSKMTNSKMTNSKMTNSKMLNTIETFETGNDFLDSASRVFERINIGINEDSESLEDKIQRYYPQGIREFTMKNINDERLYGKIPVLTDDDLLELGLVDCSECPDGQFVNPNNKGCKKGVDTICIPHTKCKTDGSELLVRAGTKTSDNVCGKCQCPRGFFGREPNVMEQKLLKVVPLEKHVLKTKIQMKIYFILIDLEIMETEPQIMFVKNVLKNVQ